MSGKNSISSTSRRAASKPVTVAVSRKSSNESNSGSSLAVSAITPTIEVQLEISGADESLIERLPVSMNTTATDIINSLLAKHVATLDPDRFEFYLKECFAGNADIYSRVMDGQEKIIQSLNKQQEGKHLYFTLYEQEKENIASSEGLQLGSEEILQPQFFSPPHVVTVNDNKYKRRSSLPSYVSFTGKHEENVKVEENGSGKNGSLKSMTDIMNEVVMETDKTRLSSSPSSKSSPSYSPVISSLVVRPLICSPYVSPEKLYPKFVFTPKVSPQTTDSEKASYSLDTTGDTSSCSGSPVSEIGGQQSEQELPLKDKEDSEDHLQIAVTIEDQSEQAMESENESVSLSVKQRLFTCDSDSINAEESSHKVTESAVHTAVMRPTPSKKAPHIVRASSSLEDESVRDTKYSFVKRETRVHSPTPSTTPSVSPVPQIDSDDREPKSPTIELLTLKDSSPAIDSSPEPAKDVDKTVKSNQYPSEMNLADSLSSYLSSAFSDENSLTLKLISPDRTNTLIDEATTHARRRRPSAKKTLSSKAISESGLTATSTAQGSPLRLKHHTSTPLISPARHDMLIRQASERILAKRKSIISNEDGHLEECSGGGTGIQPLNLTSVSEDHSLMEVEPSPSESITTHDATAVDTVTDLTEDLTGTKRNRVTRGNIKRHNSERSQRRQLSGLFKWRSFRGNTRQNNKEH